MPLRWNCYYLPALFLLCPAPLLVAAWRSRGETTFSLTNLSGAAGGVYVILAPSIYVFISVFRQFIALMQPMHDSKAPAEVPREADLKPDSNVEAGDEIGGQSSLRKPGTQRSLGKIGLCISAASLGLYQHKSGPGLKPFLRSDRDQSLYAILILSGAVVQLIAGKRSFSAGEFLEATLQGAQGGFFLALSILQWPILETNGMSDGDMAAGSLAIGLFLSLWIATCSMLIVRLIKAKDVSNLALVQLAFGLLCLLGVEIMSTVFGIEANALHKLSVIHFGLTVLMGAWVATMQSTTPNSGGRHKGTDSSLGASSLVKDW